MTTISCLRSSLLRSWPLAVLGLSHGTNLPAAKPADLVVRHANVLTVDTNHPRAEAFAVAGDEFVVVGSLADVEPFIGPRTQVLDLGGRTIVPGFNDAHAHPAPVYPEDSRWASVDCGPRKVRTMEELIAATNNEGLRKKIKQTAASN